MKRHSVFPCSDIPMYIQRPFGSVGTVVGKTIDPQQKFSRGHFNLHENLNQNFQHRR